MIARYLRQPIAWALEQPRPLLVKLASATIELMKMESKGPKGVD